MGFDTAFDVYMRANGLRAEMSHIIGSNTTSALDIQAFIYINKRMTSKHAGLVFIIHKPLL